MQKAFSKKTFLISDVFMISSLIISLTFLLFGIWLDINWLGLIPPITLIVIFLLLYRLNVFYILLFFLIPWSIEVRISGGIGIDFPSELILVVFSIITLFLLAQQPIDVRLLKPLGTIIIIQLGWHIVTMLTGVDLVISGKWILAKTWYILAFFVLPFFIIKRKEQLHQLLDFYLLGLLLAACYFFIDHALTGFDFMAKSSVGKPFWRNHVNYACTLVIAFPMIYYRYKTHLIGTGLRYIVLGLIFLVFLYFSYARVAYLCLGIWIIYMLILKWRLTQVGIVAAVIFVGVIAFKTIQHERYIQLAPEFSQAITQESFEKKLNATLEGRDISTMERLHRWVAGYRMVKQSPIIGIGPANFYNTYKPFTLYSFETYVSDNPEHSGIHNYYLMVLVEQGFPGLILLIVLLIAALIMVERKYHKPIATLGQRQILMLGGSILIIIATMNTINDMIEVIKIGSWFFFALFLISCSMTFDKDINLS